MYQDLKPVVAGNCDIYRYFYSLFDDNHQNVGKFSFFFSSCNTLPITLSAILSVDLKSGSKLQILASFSNFISEFSLMKIVFFDIFPKMSFSENLISFQFFKNWL